ncbi:hypothetical protein [Mesorhizobium sp. M0019]|uniref:hypothetical protein n=1 Tax=Mesorhizobium sp. M0019 TaxID=2956845 RepID=UPI00333D9D33
MRKSSAVAGMLVLALSTAPSLSGETTPVGTPISIEAVRLASDRVYSDLLRRAYANGWRYPPEQIKSGFKRHFEETRLQLIDQGYIIVPDVSESVSQ